MKAAAFFPGQGSQFVGMGADLVKEFQEAKHVFEEASDALGEDVFKLCTESSEDELNLTANTQPALLTASIASFRVAEKKLGFEPRFVAGHSLGEYSALVAAGSLTLSNAVKWVRTRGQAMQEAVPVGKGSMAAVLGGDDGQVEDLCKQASEGNEVVEPANYNAPGQLVIAGTTSALEKAAQLAKSDSFTGLKVRPLSVSAPFHSSLMVRARDKMADLFSNLEAPDQPGPLRCEYYPNRTAKPTNSNDVVLEYLVEQIDHPVLWKQSVEKMIENHFEQAIEFGPGKVLAGLAKRIAKPLGAQFSVETCGDPEGVRNLEKFLS